MFKLENRHGLLIAELSVLSKNENKYGTVNLVLDTGSFITIIDPSYTNFWGYSVRDAKRISRLDGAGGTSEGYVIKAPSVKCFDLEITDFEIACHELDSKLNLSGLLGMNFLNNFRLDIDLKKGIIYKIDRI